jgi:hypothetical protein
MIALYLLLAFAAATAAAGADADVTIDRLKAAAERAESLTGAAKQAAMSELAGLALGATYLSLAGEALSLVQKLAWKESAHTMTDFWDRNNQLSMVDMRSSMRSHALCVTPANKELIAKQVDETMRQFGSAGLTETDRALLIAEIDNHEEHQSALVFRDGAGVATFSQLNVTFQMSHAMCNNGPAFVPVFRIGKFGFAIADSFQIWTTSKKRFFGSRVETTLVPMKGTLTFVTIAQVMMMSHMLSHGSMPPPPALQQ